MSSEDERRMTTRPLFPLLCHSVDMAEGMGRVKYECKQNQKRETEKLLKKSLVCGDTWYVIHSDWFKRYKQFIGMEDEKEYEHPGPIDNGALYKCSYCADMQEHLIEDIDYVLVPDELWNHLLSWFGMVAGQTPIARKVIEYGSFVKTCKVEVYLLNLNLVKDFDMATQHEKTFSKANTVEYLSHVMRNVFHIDKNMEIRLWGVFSPNTYDQLTLENTIEAESLFMNQVVVIEVRRPDGSWVRPDKKDESENALQSNVENVEKVGNMGQMKREGLCLKEKSDADPSTNTNKIAVKAYQKSVEKMEEGESSHTDEKNNAGPSVLNNAAERANSNTVRKVQKGGYELPYDRDSIHPNDRKNVHPLDRSLVSAFTLAQRYLTFGGDTFCEDLTPGLCGLCNLGNTCFMNSVLQCMSNCPPVVKHFIGDEYLKDLNAVNPLGMRGEIASAFGKLIKIMWSGRVAVTSPNHFKVQVGKFAPQFSGYQQHDSQELLTFLLDGLHEDLNRIKRKPYIELNDAGGRPDEVVSQEAWENYQKRNDSIIVDNFHGLLKSTVICPDCGKVSVTFDPFCYLSLPLPMKRERHIEVKYFPFDPKKTPQIFNVPVPRRGQVSDLTKSMAQQCSVEAEDLVVAEITKHHFHKFFDVHDLLESIDTNDDIAVYEIPHVASHVPVPVVLWEINPKQEYNFSQLFAFPLILLLPQNNCTYEDLYRAVLDKLRRYLSLPENGDCVPHKEIPNSASTSCDDSHKDLFSLYVINASTTSVAYKLHNDGNTIHLPKSDPLGRQYIAAQWTIDNHKKFFNREAISEIEDHEPTQHKRSQRINLSDCIELYTMREKLGVDDAWYCPVCKKHQRATKKFDLWSLPRILIIHLKRFSYSRHRREKLDAHVYFPYKDFDMKDYVIKQNHSSTKYNLIGVCNHYGGMAGGHYTAYAQNKINKYWYSFDDQHVTKIAAEAVCTNSAYVLFYMRNE